MPHRSTERLLLYGAGALVAYSVLSRAGRPALGGLPPGVETTESILGITGPIPPPTGQGDPFLRGETPCGFPGSPPCPQLSMPYDAPAQIDPTIGDPYALEVPPAQRYWYLPTQQIPNPASPDIVLNPCIDPMTGLAMPC